MRILRIMESRITATELARRIGDTLGRIRYRGDTFVVERNGVPIARLSPVTESRAATLADALAAWRAAGEADPEFADALERVGTLDRPTAEPWAS
jgi:antitoxin (DNA-binding transcriptional repressor) of toxin-antitoxin stability system